MNRLSRRQLLKRGALALAGGVAAPHLIPAGVLASGDQPGPTTGLASARLASAAGQGCCSINCPRTAASWPCATAICRGPRHSKPSSRPCGRSSRTIKAPGTQGHRCGDHRHRRVSAGIAVNGRLSGREGRLRRETVDALHPGRPALVNLVRRCGRVFQVGTQQRSMAMNRIACELVAAAAWKGPRGPHGELSLVAGRAGAALSRRKAAGRAGLGYVAESGLMATVQREVDGLDELARLCRRRDHELGGARLRPGSMGAGDGRHRSRGSAAAYRRTQRPGRVVTPTPCRSASCWSTPDGRRHLVCEKGKLEINRNKFASNPKGIAEELRKKVNVAEESGNGATTSRSGRPAGISRIGLTAPRPASGPWPTWKSATARSPSATWSTLPGGGTKAAMGPGKGAFRRRRPGQPLRHPPAPQGLRTADLVSPGMSPFAPRKWRLADCRLSLRESSAWQDCRLSLRESSAERRNFRGAKGDNRGAKGDNRGAKGDNRGAKGDNRGAKGDRPPSGGDVCLSMPEKGPDQAKTGIWSCPEQPTRGDDWGRLKGGGHGCCRTTA